MFDAIYSKDYDLSEEGFIKRNKDWMKFPEKFRKGIKKDVVELMKSIAADRKAFRELK